MTTGRGAVRLPPYAAALGIRIDHWDGAYPVIALDFSTMVNGNPKAFHGGALGGLLEMAAIAALQAEVNEDGLPPRLKPANLTVEFLRGAGMHTTYARGEVVRRGRRLANLRAVAWQESPDKPVAICFTNVLLAPHKQ
ncbi:MAG: acyl-CoA thioesterase domain-containing protein [Pseudomonadota bacterium]